ncbi:methionine ABC transporter ATP-binding protein [Skermanella stibiiresistens SB22]|uniref:Cell division ATP-binding protein FtsE n=1 Tax=Skermanella stibiiresistens SB22 TaxID=1385369 RepID=W9H583_9PROT|nr:methionine ABC transporter ATP-binding protein [Skermanella stibiiresistens]EWY41189.1 methionine ABC transporter ATP-binding protein [Skermanella stibiiresistens SB22]
MIEFQGVEKVFSGRGGGPEVRALDGIDLSIGRGEIFGIIGRSGAGKSTLIRVVNMLERPTAGSVSVDGVDMAALDGAGLRDARRAIGMIFQHFNLLSSRTVYDNVALPLELAGLRKSEIKAKVEPLLELVGLGDKRDRYPAELSGGQKQRVGIARALSSEPKVLLCDEATSALDPETTTSILRLLADINAKLGLTIVLITHEMAVIKEICHRVAVMESGTIIERGDVFDVFTAPRHATTRSFVSSVVGAELPETLSERLVAEPVAGGNAVLRITFKGAMANTPIISQLTRRFGLDLNILHGRIDHIQDAPFGVLVVEAVGAADAVQSAISFINANNLSVEVLGHVPANLRAAG